MTFKQIDQSFNFASTNIKSLISVWIQKMYVFGLL
jgi:hypothetical protein